MCKQKLAFLKNLLKREVQATLRFAVDDIVECYVAATESWWAGVVVEIYYHERAFELHYNAPYRVRLIGELDPPEAKVSDEPVPDFIVIHSDIDRFVRMPGTQAIEGTRPS